MKAMIFAAGLGTRLRPLTNACPKAMVLLHGKPLLQHVIEKLKASGFTKIVVNVHHFGEQIIRFLANNNNFGMDIQVSDERSLLLNTGGGLKKAAPILQTENANDSFLVHNVDVVSNLDLNLFMQQHQKMEGIATLAVSQRPSSRYLLFNQQARLCGWKNTKTGEERIIRSVDVAMLQPLAFSGIHAIKTDIFNNMPAQDVFSIIDTYLEVGANYPIYAYIHQRPQIAWFDVGKPERLKAAADWLISQ